MGCSLPPGARPTSAAEAGPRRSPRQRLGDAAEQRALERLLAEGLSLVARQQGGRVGEIDLVMRDGDTLVFVEVRSRARRDFGGAAASVGWQKQQRVRRAAQAWLLRRYGNRWPACRFDVCAEEAGRMDWIRGAF